MTRKMRLLTTIMTLTFTMNIVGAGDFFLLKKLPDYSCVKYENNTLTFPGNRSHFISLYSQIDSMLYSNSGQISILHIGGSHVQAGFFGDQMRRNLSDSISGTHCGKGVLFPFKAMKTNAPTNYRISVTGKWNRTRCVDRSLSLELGITGAAISSRDSLASIYFNLNPNDTVDIWKYNSLTLFIEDSLDCVNPLLICGNDTISVTNSSSGFATFQLPYETSDGTIIFPNIETSPITIRGLFPQNDRMGIVYHEAGINGASVQSWLKCSHFEQDLAQIIPDLVILAVGINDANVPPARFDAELFKRNYRKLIDRIKKINPNCAFIFVTNNDCRLNIRKYRKRFNPNTEKVEKIFFELAEEYDGAIWNLYRIMGGARSANTCYKTNLMHRDRIHFTRAGYELLGDLLYNALITDYLETGGDN